MTGRHTDKRSLVDLLSFLFDRLDDDEAAARAQLTPATIRRNTTPGGPARAFRELAAKRSMVAMWFDGVQADLSRPPVAGLNVADAMIMALVTVYATTRSSTPAGWPTSTRRSHRRGSRSTTSSSCARDGRNPLQER